MPRAAFCVFFLLRLSLPVGHVSQSVPRQTETRWDTARCIIAYASLPHAVCCLTRQRRMPELQPLGGESLELVYLFLLRLFKDLKRGWYRDSRDQLRQHL